MTTATNPQAAPWRAAVRSRRDKLREMWAQLGLIAGQRRDRVSDLYELLSSHNNLGRDSLYLNMGYWRDADDYDAACEALAMKLADSAGLADGQRVVDAGFGFGDQDLAWARRWRVDIVGFNIVDTHVRVARERVAREGLADRIELRKCSALETGLADASVDRVVALESAFHFPSREAFFAEAHRILRPGGRIALADLTLPAHRSTSLAGRLLDTVGLRIARAFWQIPAGNLYDAEGYAQRLRAAGFANVAVEVITADVFLPFGRHARRRQRDADVVARANPLLRAVWRGPATETAFDYVIVTADKPGEGGA